MSIENGVATGAPKATAQTVSGHGQGKAKTGAAGTGGFAALLQDLGGESLTAQGGLATAGAESPEDRATDEDSAAQAQPALTGEAGAILAATLQQTGPSGENSGTALLPAMAGNGLKRIEQQALAANAQDDPAELSVPQASDRDARPAASELQPLLRQAALAQRMTQQRQQADAAAAQTVKEQRGEDIAARLGWQVSDRLGPSIGNTPQIVLAAAVAEAGGRPLERRHEKGEREIRVGDAQALSSAAQPDGFRLDVPAAAPDAGLMTEMRVAEQVSYWASRGGVQNAELQVDGLGEGPVKVSIALQGQEARVEFRADQVQTRQVLEDAMPHLRELLAREGLVLAGVSVGGSGTDGAAGRQPREGRQGARQAAVAVPELPAVSRPAARGAVLSGRSVDLFV